MIKLGRHVQNLQFVRSGSRVIVVPMPPEANALFTDKVLSNERAVLHVAWLE